MARAFYLLFGLLAYLIFFATFRYLIAFVGDLPWVPRTVDRGHAVVGPGHFRLGWRAPEARAARPKGEPGTSPRPARLSKPRHAKHLADQGPDVP
ncbi:MAG TPA: hypothetical protein VK614_12295 [Allosphingosinicella sp.]|nr:hypothetical protein [Allosphingosinicella sp.]